MKALLFLFIIGSGPWRAFAQSLPIDDQIDKEFLKLADGTTSASNVAFGQETGLAWTKPSAFIANTLIATAVNYTLDKSAMSVGFVFPKQGVKRPDPVVVKVQPIDVQCNFCRQCSECSFPYVNCDVGCYLERAACMTTALPAITACETLKQASKAADGDKILEVDFQDLELAAQASSSRVRVNLDGALNPTVRLENLSAVATVNGQATVQFEDIPGLLTACFPVAQTLIIPPTQASIKSNEFVVGGTLDRATEGNKLNMTLRLHELKPQLQIDGNPFWDVLKSNPLFTVTCVIPSRIMAWTGLVQLLFPISVDLKLEGRAVPLSVTSISAPFAGPKYVLQPKSTSTSVGIVAEVTTEAK